MNSDWTSLAKYFAFDTKKYKMEEFFSDMKTFKQQFEVIFYATKIVVKFAGLKLFAIKFRGLLFEIARSQHCWQLIWDGNASQFFFHRMICIFSSKSAATWTTRLRTRRRRTKSSRRGKLWLTDRSRPTGLDMQRREWTYRLEEGSPFTMTRDSLLVGEAHSFLIIWKNENHISLDVEKRFWP